MTGNARARSPIEVKATTTAAIPRTARVVPWGFNASFSKDKNSNPNAPAANKKHAT
ncbi:MAG: hypothetical protein R3F62_30860 [Planctomycetota bacterium]